MVCTVCTLTTVVLDFDGNVATGKDQVSISWIFMQIVQLSPGICHVEMYDKRDISTGMPALASTYRKCPRIETTVSTSCKYAVLRSQLCRFAYLCIRRSYFVDAASRLIRDNMWLHG